MKLEERWDEADVKYAILSHRWQDEEVSFQAMQDLDVASTLKGFAKIRATCQMVLSDGLPAN